VNEIGQTDNLIPFKPGQSGNPNGRPRGILSFKRVLKRYLEVQIDNEDPIAGMPDKISVQEALALRLIALGLAGNLAAIREIREIVDGSITQQIDIIDARDSVSLDQRLIELRKRLEDLKSGAVPDAE
jgi:hypothetical protein